MSFRTAVESGKFVVTAEVGPPKGTDVETMLEETEALVSRVDAINVTDNQSSVMRLGSLAACCLIKDKGAEPVFQLTCRDRNRLALQTDLLSAAVLGIENVLSITGDYVNFGDHPDAMPVFDLDSVQLLQVIRTLQEGRDMVGNDLEGAPTFFPGAIVNPGAEPLEPQIFKLEKKVEAGARFIQTQGVYDLDLFARFMDRVAGIGVPILGGVIMLKSAGMARFLNNQMAGVVVPDHLVEQMASAEDKVEASVAIGAALARGFQDLCQGVHIMPIGWERHVPALLDAAEL